MSAAYVAEVAAFLRVEPNVLLVLGSTLLVLALGSIVRLLRLRKAPPAEAKNRVHSLISWWALSLVFAAAILLGRAGGVVFVAVLSFLGLREYLSLLPPHGSTWRVFFWAYVTIVLNYLWVYLDLFEVFLVFTPIVVFLFLPARMVLTGNTRGFLRDVTGLYWGLVLTVFCLSHSAYLLVLPSAPNPAGGGAGWFLYLVLLTETNDIAQALWGRRFGVHKLTPRVSPNKTWEGFAGGFLTTMILALFLAPLLTPLADAAHVSWNGFAADVPYLWATAAGLIITIGGLIGDISMSAIKRDVGVKDSGVLVPGQGGILDRIDSLTFTSPLFFYFVYFLYY